MPSRKTVLLGAGALVLIVVAVALVKGGGPSLNVERGDTSRFPLRGSLADDQGAIDDAIDAWKDDPRVGKSDVHVLYAGKISDRSVVVLDQADRAILVTQPSDDGWKVEGTTRFDPVDASPADLNDVLLLPAGDWTWLPLVHDAFPPRTLDGLVDGGAELKPGFALEKRAANDLGSLYDVDAGLFRIDADNYDRIIEASQQPGGLLAIHAGLTGEDERQLTTANVRFVDVLWTGKLPGAGQAAIVARDPTRLGLGIVDDPDDSLLGAAHLSLGSENGPLGTRRDNDSTELAQVGAAYVIDDDNRPQTLVAAATGPVDHFEILAGKRTITRPGPVAFVPVDWDPYSTDAVVVGRTKSRDLIAPLTPLSR